MSNNKQAVGGAWFFFLLTLGVIVREIWLHDINGLCLFIGGLICMGAFIAAANEASQK